MVARSRYDPNIQPTSHEEPAMSPSTPPYLLLIHVASLATLVALVLTLRPLPAQASWPTASDGWQPIALPSGISAADISDLAVHPASAGTLFLATSSSLSERTALRFGHAVYCFPCLTPLDLPTSWPIRSHFAASIGHGGVTR